MTAQTRNRLSHRPFTYIRMNGKPGVDKKPAKPKPPVKGKKTSQQVADDIWAGRYGWEKFTGANRVKRLNELNYNAKEVQKELDKLAGVTKPKPKPIKGYQKPKGTYKEVGRFTNTTTSNIKMRQYVPNIAGKFNGNLAPNKYVDYKDVYKGNGYVWVGNGTTWIPTAELGGKAWGTWKAIPKAKPKPKKVKWLRIPTTVPSYSYYNPKLKPGQKTTTNRMGIIKPRQYRNQASYLEYKVIAERGNFKTIQLHGDKRNPAIDIFTGKGTEHAWKIVMK